MRYSRKYFHFGFQRVFLPFLLNLEQTVTIMSFSPFEQLWRYNNWANDRILQLLESYGDKTPAASIRFLSHIMNVQRNWHNRIAGNGPVC